MFDIAIIYKKNYKTPDNWSETYISKYNSDHLVIQSWSVTLTTKELPLAFRTNAYFVAPDIKFLVKHPVNFFHRFGTVVVQEGK